MRENAERHIRQALSLAKNTLKSMDNHAQLLKHDIHLAACQGLHQGMTKSLTLIIRYETADYQVIKKKLRKE